MNIMDGLGSRRNQEEGERNVNDKQKGQIIQISLTARDHLSKAKEGKDIENERYWQGYQDAICRMREILNYTQKGA